MVFVHLTSTYVWCLYGPQDQKTNAGNQAESTNESTDDCTERSQR